MIVTLLIIPMASPFLVGVYHDDKLIDMIEGDLKISDEFPIIYKQLNNKHNIDTIYFVNGPGSYMAIKLIYIFLQTISVLQEITIKSSLGFNFNNNQPIKALGNKYFIQKNDTIELEGFDNKLVQQYTLPKDLDRSIFSENLEPIYILPVT